MCSQIRSHLYYLLLIVPKVLPRIIGLFICFIWLVWFKYFTNTGTNIPIFIPYSLGAFYIQLIAFICLLGLLLVWFDLIWFEYSTNAGTNISTFMSYSLGPTIICFYMLQIKGGGEGGVP